MLVLSVGKAVLGGLSLASATAEGKAGRKGGTDLVGPDAFKEGSRFAVNTALPLLNGGSA